jgi:hypothetical protein
MKENEKEKEKRREEKRKEESWSSTTNGVFSYL